MNYEGLVTSVNTTLWTFQIDNTITVHMGYLAAYKLNQSLPEVGGYVQLSNAHYKVSKLFQLQKLFLCEKSRIVCSDYKDHEREDLLLDIIRGHNLGVSDLLEIDYNINVVDKFLKELVEESLEEIILKVLECLVIKNKQTKNDCHVHECSNKSILSFSLITIFNCQYIDLHSNHDIKGPPWSFGVHTKNNKRDILIGYLLVNKHGIVCLRDTKYNMSCLITSRKEHIRKCDILNRFVLIKEYRIFTETYRESGVSNLEYILFDIEDVLLLDLKLPKQFNAFSIKQPDNILYLHNFEFKLLKKSTINLFKESLAECWLEVLYPKTLQHAYLGLNHNQMQVVPYLEEGRTYHAYHSMPMRVYTNFELTRLKSLSISHKFDEKNVVFALKDHISKHDEFADAVLNVIEALEKLKENCSCVSFQGLLSVKKLTPALASRTKRSTKSIGFGTPGTQTHTLIFTDDARECSLLLYLNNWENLQIPLGLIVDMRVCVRNVLPQKGKYFKACAMTTFEILSYEPLVDFNTVNLKAEQTYGCDQYCYLGLGDLIPCNALIWAKNLQLSIRSLKITYKCVICNYVIPKYCCCEVNEPKLETTITLFVYDEMGQSVVISKSMELLRLLLGLETKQWEVWCTAFKSIGEYVHVFEETSPFTPQSDDGIFRTALAISIKVINVMRISDLELKCRKMESSTADNEGMPKWFCVDARRRCLE